MCGSVCFVFYLQMDTSEPSLQTTVTESASSSSSSTSGVHSFSSSAAIQDFALSVTVANRSLHLGLCRQTQCLIPNGHYDPYPHSMRAMAVHLMTSRARDMVENMLSDEMQLILDRMRQGSHESIPSHSSSSQSSMASTASSDFQEESDENLDLTPFLGDWTVKFPLAHRVSVSFFPEPHMAMQAASSAVAPLPQIVEATVPAASTSSSVVSNLPFAAHSPTATLSPTRLDLASSGDEPDISEMDSESQERSFRILGHLIVQQGQSAVQISKLQLVFSASRESESNSSAFTTVSSSPASSSSSSSSSSEAAAAAAIPSLHDFVRSSLSSSTVQNSIPTSESLLARRSTKPMVWMLSALATAQQTQDPLAVASVAFSSAMLLIYWLRQYPIAMQLLSRLASECEDVLCLMRMEGNDCAFSYARRFLASYAQRARVIVSQYKRHVSAGLHTPFFVGETKTLPLGSLFVFPLVLLLCVDIQACVVIFSSVRSCSCNLLCQRPA